MPHAVVLRDPEVPDDRVAALGEALAAATGTPRFDAVQRVKRSEGVLLDGADEPAARNLAEAVRALGVEAAVAPTDAAARYRKRIPIRRAECSDAEMRIEIQAKGWRKTPWSSIRAGTLALYREPRVVVRTDTRHRRSVGRVAFGVVGAVGLVAAPSAYRWAKDIMQARDRVARLQGEENVILDLFVEPGVTLRFEARRFHYGYLGARMHERCELNFHSLAADIVSRARDAVFAPAVHEFLDGRLGAEAAVTDVHDLDLFSRWFLLATAAFQSK